MSIAENVAVIREKIRQAALAAGRDPSEISLCAATKMNGPEAVREAIAAGVESLRENRDARERYVRNLKQEDPEEENRNNLAALLQLFDGE